MLGGTLGNPISAKYNIELLEAAQLYHTKPFPIPIVHEETLKTEVNILVNMGVLKRKNKSKWVVPIFTIP